MSDITARQLVADLAAAGIDSLAVRHVRNGLAAIAAQVRARTLELADGQTVLPLDDVLELIDPNSPGEGRP